VLLDLSDDQEFFRDTSARFLREQAPPGALRELRDDADGFDATYWRRGAELGWTSLLVDEAHGGGSISGTGLVDLTLVAHEFGRHAAPGPLAATNVVASALSDADAHGDVLASLLDGSTIASWCPAEPRPHDGLGEVAATIRVDGDDLVVDGVKRPVESAARSSHLLVTGRGPEGLTQVLVPTDSAGVSMVAMQSVDLTRRFDEVTFTEVRVPLDAAVGAIGDGERALDRQLRLAAVIASAESVGAMQAALDMTVEWAFDRYSFGRPLASYQELKHRFADMKTWLEASHAVSDAAAAAVAVGAPDADELVSSAKAYIGTYGAELMQDCVQIHGGIGVTYEHDLHLYLRRQILDRSLYGTPSDHLRRLTDLVQQEDAA